MARQSILLLSGSTEWADRVLAWRQHFDVHRAASAEEARALLTGSRPWAALLMDGAHHEADRDLIALSVRHGARPVVVASRGSPIDWLQLGAHRVLPPDLDAKDLGAVLAGHASREPAGLPLNPLVCVTGPGGTGASSVAIATSQGLAGQAGRVALVDLRRNAELHMLHHIDPAGPGIGDLVEAHRTSSPDAATLAGLATPVGRGYGVLAGLRRAVGWSSVRPRALAVALEGLRTANDVVVCDVDPDLEGEAEGGSVDVEERNALARTAVAQSSCVVVVGGPGAKGTHSLLRVLGELWSHGVAADQTVAVVNRGDTSALERLSAALEQLGAHETAKLFLPEVELEPLLLSDEPLPEEFVAPVTRAVLPLLLPRPAGGPPPPERVAPGSLGLHKQAKGHDPPSTGPRATLGG